MNIHDVSTYLLRFDAPAPPAAPPVRLDAFAEQPIEPLFEEASSHSGAHKDAVDVEALRRVFDEELAASLEKQQAAHEESLRAARAQWTKQQGEVLARRLSETLADALATLRADVARILAPFVASEVERATIEDLNLSIRRAIAGDYGPAIQLEGPRDLIDKISEALAEQHAAVSLVETDGVDISVDLGLTKLETRLEAWMRRLSENRS